jgi:hypothetical protein
VLPRYRRVLGRAGFAAALALAAACTGILGIDAPLPLREGTGGGAAAGGDGAPGGGEPQGGGGRGASGEGGRGGQGGQGGACAPVTFHAFATEDGNIFDGACNGGNNYGTSSVMNIGLGKGLIRFPLPDEVVQAYLDERVVSMSVELARGTNCDGQPCPAEAGTFVARPLRNDWSEGIAGMQFSGAEWCRRLPGNPGPQWEAPGATALGIDVWGVSGSATADAAQPTLSIDLDPSEHALMVDREARLSVIVYSEDGGVFCAAAQEHTNPPMDAARLRVSYCL